MRKTEVWLPDPRLQLAAVKLYLDDLEAIEVILKRNGMTEVPFEVPVPGYAFDDVADLANSPIPTVDAFYVVSEHPFYIDVHVGGRSTEVHGSASYGSGSSDTEVRGVVAQVGELLAKRQRRVLARAVRRRSVVHLRRRHDMPDRFWNRRRDEVLLVLLSGAVGFVLGLLADVVT